MTANEFVEAFNELCEQEEKEGTLDKGELQVLLGYQKDCFEWMSRECWKEGERDELLKMFRRAIQFIKAPGAMDRWAVCLSYLKGPFFIKGHDSFIVHYTQQFCNYLDEEREMYDYEKDFFNNPLKLSELEERRLLNQKTNK